MGDMITKVAGVDQIEWIAQHSTDSVMQNNAYTATGKCNGHQQPINYIEEYLDYIQRDATYYVKGLKEFHWEYVEIFESESIPQTIKSISKQGVHKSYATSNQKKANTIDLSLEIEIEVTDLSESVKEQGISKMCMVVPCSQKTAIPQAKFGMNDEFELSLEMIMSLDSKFFALGCNAYVVQIKMPHNLLISDNIGVYVVVDRGIMLVATVISLKL